MTDLTLAVLVGLLVAVIAAAGKAFALSITMWAVRAWVWLLTLGMADDVRAARCDAVESDLWEHQADSLDEGYAPHLIALQMILRLVVGLPDDALWRLKHTRSGYVPLATTVALTAGGLAIAWDGNLVLTVIRVTVVVAAAALLVAIAVTRERVVRLPEGISSVLRRRESSGSPDYSLLVTAAVLLFAGMLAVYWAGRSIAELEYGSTNYFLVRQAAYAIVGVIALVYFMRLDYRQLRYLAVPMMVVALLGLLAVLIPGIGAERNGARRWVELGPLSFQPAEFAKLAVIIYISAWLAGRRENIRKFSLGLVPFVLMVGVVADLVIVEPDMGTAMIIVLTATTLFFVAGAPLSHLGLLVVTGTTVSYFIFLMGDYRLDRITYFLSPESDPQGGGYQSLQLVGAVDRGGLTGHGLGSADAVAFLLPGPHADSIFAVVAYSVGFVGVAVLIGLFCLFVSRGLRTALFANDRFGALLALGVTCWIGYQALCNIAGAVHVIPVNGVALPLISYGGPSIVAVMAAVGVLLSVSRHRQESPPATALSM